VFRKLKGILAENDVDQKQLSAVIKKSQSYVTARMNSSRSWDMDDVYAVLDMLGVNYQNDEIFKYFPPSGKEPKTSIRKVI